jgi:hydrogenase expression/formation protein HypE
MEADGGLAAVYPFLYGDIGKLALPVRETMRGLCEVLGLDPLHLANEGKIVAVVPATESEGAVAALRGYPLGRDPAIIGHVPQGTPARAVLRTMFSGRRIIDILVGEQLPRIG